MTTIEWAQNVDGSRGKAGIRLSAAASNRRAAPTATR